MEARGERPADLLRVLNQAPFVARKRPLKLNYRAAWTACILIAPEFVFVEIRALLPVFLIAQRLLTQKVVDDESQRRVLRPGLAGC